MSTQKRNAHDEMIKSWKQDPEFLAAYNALEAEFSLFDKMVNARKKAGLTQNEVAEKMNTYTSAISRLETLSAKNSHSPTVETLEKYAEAVKCKLVIDFIPIENEKQAAQPPESQQQSK